MKSSARAWPRSMRRKALSDSPNSSIGRCTTAWKTRNTIAGTTNSDTVAKMASVAGFLKTPLLAKRATPAKMSGMTPAKVSRP